jgi:type II secretory pathway pseudopilin PulG
MAPITRRSSPARRAVRPAAGFTYIGLLIAVAVAGIALAAAGMIWTTEARREREAQLLFAGEQYMRAIQSYYDATPGGAKQFPRSLEELVEDRRLPVTRRHLRRLYPEPMGSDGAWVLMRTGPNGTIIGVHSRSEQPPLKRANFPSALDAFSNAQRYSDWKFAFAPGAGAPGAVAPGAGAPGAGALGSGVPRASPTMTAPAFGSAPDNRAP